MSTKVAVIGIKNQAARHIERVRKRKDLQLSAVYHPTAKKGDLDLPVTNNFDEVLRSDAVIISSPTPTHADYLQRLNDFQGYVLIEKPAVSTLQENKILEAWGKKRKSRTRVNFNLCFSRLTSVLREVLVGGMLGNLITFDVHTSQGLAFHPRYEQSWRSAKGSSFGVLETVGVHYLHLVLLLFGKIVKLDFDLMRKAGHREGPPDVGIFRLQMSEGPLITLRHTYASPCCNRMFLLGTNGFWEYDGMSSKLYAPRDTFDKNGRFIVPPVIREDKIEHPLAWRESLERAQENFFSIVLEGGCFEPEEFDLALRAMEPIFAAQKREGLL